MISRVLMAGVLVFAASVAVAADLQWNGGAGGNFSDASQWLPSTSASGQRHGHILP